MTLGGCFGAADRPVEVAVIGPSAAAFVGGPRLPAAAQLLRAATVEGLVGFDDQGRVVPALADRWIVTDDGRSSEPCSLTLHLDPPPTGLYVQLTWDAEVFANGIPNISAIVKGKKI